MTINTADSRTRRPRSDSERNRAQILLQAEKHFTAHGVGASLESVARDAGVGSATLYRHFPTRDSLLAALLERRAAQLVDEERRIKQVADSGEALKEWLEALEDFFGAFDGLSDPLRAAVPEQHNPLATTCIGYIDITDRFLRAAQHDGKARMNVRGRDLFLSALALSWVRGAAMADHESRERLRELTREGFTTPTER